MVNRNTHDMQDVHDVYINNNTTCTNLLKICKLKEYMWKDKYHALMEDQI